MAFEPLTPPPQSLNPGKDVYTASTVDQSSPGDR